MANSIEAKVRYLDASWKGRAERPRIGSRETRHANTSPLDVRIEDARPLHERGELDLDTQGFVLTRHRSEVADFRDDAQVTRTYYEEMKRRVAELTGAEHVFMLQHVRRTETSKSFNEAYARYVHCDFSVPVATRSARRMLVERGRLAPEEAERCAFAWYNVWQPFDREVAQNPLTMIDSRTVREDELVEYTFADYGDGDGVALVPIFSPEHRFYYFPRMQTNEAIVFKQLDSRPDRSRFCPHTSFHDPTAPADAPGRRSIELRMLCGFGAA
jgi:hypothetical protein